MDIIKAAHSVKVIWHKDVKEHEFQIQLINYFLWNILQFLNFQEIPTDLFRQFGIRLANPWV